MAFPRIFRHHVPIAFLLVTFTLSTIEAAGPWCFACSDAAHPALCQFVAQCGDHESCTTEKVVNYQGGEFFTTGCKDTYHCHAKRRSVSRRTICDECCNGTLCNEVGCKARALKTAGRLYCLKCDFVKNPAFCDKVQLCSADEFCAISHENQFGLQYYKVGCRSKKSCPPATATIAKDNSICCDSDLCNSNDLGQNPALYTTTPIPTTRKPADPQVTFAENQLVYNITHAPKEELKILCHVTGGPVPTVEWTFDNGTTKIPIKNGFTIEPNGDSLLSIPAPEKDNAGKYTCKATNIRNTAEKTIEVIVMSPPEIKGNLNNSVVLQYQDDINLDCNVTMDNDTKVYWIHPSGVKSFTVHPNNSLTIHNVHKENIGNYICVAENPDGKTMKSFTIDVNDTSSQMSTPQPCSCPTVTAPTCPTISKTTCPQMTCPQVATVTCPKVVTTPCPTLPTPKTAPTVMANPNPQFSTTSTMPSTTSTMASTTSTPSTTSTSTTMPTTQKPMINTLPILNALTTNNHISAAAPNGNPIKANDQFQSEKRILNILQCPVASTTNGQITWSRLVNDYDHQSPIYIDNKFGILTISGQMSVLSTGVYECRVGNVPVAQFVIYEELSNAVNCNDVFGSVTHTVGAVIRAKCGVCPYTTGGVPSLNVKITEPICTSAIAAKVINAYGGDVNYLIKSNDEVVLLDEKRNNGILIP